MWPDGEMAMTSALRVRVEGDRDAEAAGAAGAAAAVTVLDVAVFAPRTVAVTKLNGSLCWRCIVVKGCPLSRRLPAVPA
jgi:hypothetical protein